MKKARPHADRKIDHGYVMIRVPEHPRTVGTGRWVYEHILVMESVLGRYLKPPEEVHHVNNIRSDNRIENLVLCRNHSEHLSLHMRKRVVDAGGNPDIHKICCRCGKVNLKTEFGKGNIRTHSDGLKGYCRPCEAEYARERRHRGKQDR